MTKIHCDICGRAPVTGLCAEHEDERALMEQERRDKHNATIDALRAENAELRAALEAEQGVSARNFRWAYALMETLAVRILDNWNADVEETGEWPAGQGWGDLVGTSKSVFRRLARDEAGIDHDEFLAGVRDGTYEVIDICERADRGESAMPDGE